MKCRISRLMYGLATFVPGVYRLFSMSRLSPSFLASDGYTKWLTHLTFAHQHGNKAYPRVVAELGPGPCFPAGMAALVSGAAVCYALDAVHHPYAKLAPRVFDEIVRLFRARTPPEPVMGPAFRLRGFPSTVLSEGHLEEALDESRLCVLRREIVAPSEENKRFRYCVPWADSAVVRECAFDMVFSSAVLEHVDDLDGTYQLMCRYLKDDGLMSHVIDFGSHGATYEWNGHWACSDLALKILRGGRPYFINREPHSRHIELLNRHGLKLIADITAMENSRLLPGALAPRYRGLSEKDLSTRSALIMAVKAGARTLAR